MPATLSLLLSVTTGVVASFTIDPDRVDEWDEQVIYRPAWLRTSCIIISFIFLGRSIFSLMKALSIENQDGARVAGSRVAARARDGLVADCRPPADAVPAGPAPPPLQIIRQ